MKGKTMNERDGIAWWHDGALGRIELRRPQRANSPGLAAGRALAHAIGAVLDAAPKAVLLTAQGPVFCAGGDIDEFRQAGAGLDQLVDDILAEVHPALERLATSPAPVVAAVGGAVGGAGVGLALSADFVLAGASMKLRTGYAAIGLSPDLGSSRWLARRVGSQRAKQWLLLSEAVDAQTCLAAGAVDAVVADDALAAAAQTLAERLARGARGSAAAIKALCDGAGQLSLAEHLALEHTLLRECARSDDAREGIAAFLAKRLPAFRS